MAVYSDIFYGASRHLLLKGLISLYNGCVESQESLIVALEAPSGWGKTRVAQEFYARLAAAQPKPRYWPDRIDDPDQGRKAVRPAPFTRGGQSLPHYFWWGIACSARNGIKTSMLRDDLKQLGKHSLYLDEARKRLTSKGGRVATMVGSAGKAIAKEGTQEFVGKAADLLLGDIVPIVGIPYRLARMGISASSAHRQRRKALAAPTLLGESDYSDLVDEALTLFAEVCEVGLPLVVYVEDIHAADEILIEVLDELIRIPGPTFIMTTTWPDMVQTNEHLKGFFDSHTDRMVRVDHEGDAGTRFPPGASLRELELEARERIVQDYYSQIRSDTLDTIVRRYNNPLALDLACSLLKTRNPASELNLQPDDITKRLPRKISDLYRQIWYELPEVARLSLAVAHVIIPTTIVSADAKNGPHDSDAHPHVRTRSQAGREDRWTHSILRDVIERLDLPNRDDVAEELVKAPHAYAWVRIIDEYLRSFVEPVQQAVIHREATELLEDELDTDDARSAVLTVLADVLMEKCADLQPSANIGRTILALHAEGFIAEPNIVAKAIEMLLQDLEDAPRELPERIRLYESFLELDIDAISGTVRHSIAQHGAVAYALYGDSQRAIGICDAVLRETEEERGPLDLPTITTRLNLAFVHGLAGDPVTADALCEATLRQAQAEGQLQRGDRNLLIAQASRARWLAEAGRVDEAVSRYQDVVTEAEISLEHDDPLILMFQNNLGRWIGEVDPNYAVEIYNDLLDRRLKVLPADHPSIIYTRYNLAFNLRRVGRIHDAVSILESQDDQAGEIFGSEHPHLVQFRMTLAWSLAETGRADEGIQVLLTQINSVEDSNTAELLPLREMLVGLYQYAEDDESTIAAITDYLELQAATTDDADEKTIAFQRALIDLLTKCERYPDAIEICNDLLKKQMDVSSSETEETVATRYRLVQLYRSTEQWDLATHVCRTLIQRSSGIWEADDPKALTSRRHLAELLFDSGELAEAAHEYADLIGDLNEQEHDLRQLAYRRLAQCHSQLGDIEQAIDAYEHMVEDLLTGSANEILVEDIFEFVADFSTLLIEHGRSTDAVVLYQSIARWASSSLLHDVRLVSIHNRAAQVYQSTGSNEDAIASYERAFSLGSKFLPSDHLENLVSRYNLAACYYAIQSYEAAISHCEALLDILTSIEEHHIELRFAMRSLLVSLYSDCEQPNRSVAALNDLLHDQREVLGPEHFETLETEFMLKVSRAKLERSAGGQTS